MQTYIIPEFKVDFSMSDIELKKLIKKNQDASLTQATVAGLDLNKVPMVKSLTEPGLTVVCPERRWVFKAYRVMELNDSTCYNYSTSLYRSFLADPREGYLLLKPIYKEEVGELDYYTDLPAGIESNKRPLFIFPLNSNYSWMVFAENAKVIAFTERKSIEKINRDMYIGKETIRPEIVWQRYVDIGRDGFKFIQKTLVVSTCDMSHMNGIVINRPIESNNNFGDAPQIVSFPVSLEKEDRMGLLRDFSKMPQKYWSGFLSKDIVIYPRRDQATYGWYKLRDSSTIGKCKNSRFDLTGHYYFIVNSRKEEEATYIHYITENVSEVFGHKDYKDGTIIPMNELIKVGRTKE